MTSSGVSRYCLDTSAYSHFMRGDPDVVALLDRAEWIGMPTIVIGELRTGFLLGERSRENERALQEFMSHPVVHVVPVDDETSRHFAETVVELRRSGTPLPTNDVWIAATAARMGALLLTYDRHFTRVARVGSMVLPQAPA
jgi:tRNA(fMet)-specific endonuclease VapC